MEPSRNAGLGFNGGYVIRASGEMVTTWASEAHGAILVGSSPTLRIL